MLTEVKLSGICVFACIPVEFDDGTVGSHLLVRAGDEKAIPAALVAWASTLSESAMAKHWANFRNMFSGCEYGDERPVLDIGGKPLSGSVKRRFVHVCVEGLRVHRCAVIGNCSTLHVNADDFKALSARFKGLFAWDASKARADIPTGMGGKLYTSAHTETKAPVISKS